MGVDAKRQDRRRRLADLRPGADATSTQTKRAARARPSRGRRVPGSGGIAPQDSLYAFYHEHGAARVLAKTQPLYGGSFKLQLPAGPERAAAVLRQRADRRRARARDEHGPDRVPPAEHRRLDRAGAALARGDRGGDAWRRAGSRRSPRRTSSSGDVVTGRGFGFGQFACSQVGDRRRRRGEQEDAARSSPSTSTSRRTTASRSARSSSATR